MLRSKFISALAIAAVTIVGAIQTLRPGTFTTLQTTDTTVNSALVGCALGVSTGCTGGIKAGKATFTEGLAISGGTISDAGIVIASDTPASTALALYNVGTTLMWNGLAVVTGSGATPGGANNDVQINVAGAFGADTGEFTYVPGTNTLTTDNVASRVGTAFTAVATAPLGGAGGAAGVNATLSASHATIGSGAGYNAGGALNLTAGNAVGQTTGNANGGAVNITAGAAAGASSTPSGGAINVTAGAGVNGLNSPGGAVNITGGAGGNPSGNVNITGGASANSGAVSGNVVIAGGSPSAGTSTTAGSVTIKTGNVENQSGVLTLTTGSLPAAHASPGTVISIAPAIPTPSTGSTSTEGGSAQIKAGVGQENMGSGLGNGTGGNGGVLTLNSGAGGTTANQAGNARLGGTGGVLNVVAGAGGAAPAAGGVTNTGGPGGALVLGSGAGGTGSTANGAAGVITINVGATEAARFNTSANLGMGTGATVSARIHSLSTTEQLRLGFDASNYLSSTVASNGGTTLAITGGGTFTFSQAVAVTGGVTATTGNVTVTAGNIVLSNAAAGTITERGRAVALGEWANQAYAGGDYTQSGGTSWTVDSGDVTTNRYTLVGKTVTWQLLITGTDVGGAPTELRVAVPGSLTEASISRGGGCGHVSDAGVSANQFAIWRMDGSGLVKLSLFSAGAWTATTGDNTSITCLITFEIS